jgi:hypothetical protein
MKYTLELDEKEVWLLNTMVAEGSFAMATKEAVSLSHAVQQVIIGTPKCELECCW